MKRGSKYSRSFAILYLETILSGSRAARQVVVVVIVVVVVVVVVVAVVVVVVDVASLVALELKP